MRKRLQSPPAYSQNLIIVVWQTIFITFACGVPNAYTACTPTTATNALSFICIMRCYTHPQCVCIELMLEKPVCVMLLLFHTAVNCVCARVYFFGWQQPQFESREMLTVVLIAKLRVILWQTRQTETLATVAANRMRRFLHYCWQLTVRWPTTTWQWWEQQRQQQTNNAADVTMSQWGDVFGDVLLEMGGWEREPHFTCRILYNSMWAFAHDEIKHGAWTAQRVSDERQCNEWTRDNPYLCLRTDRDTSIQELLLGCQVHRMLRHSCAIHKCLLSSS